ncbi:transcription initiation factor IIA subunit 1 [Agrilus planipennis]|uniref:Transcription initiation factor IIA subunit 1 n=1 Tax=Agrilus planipennis TaxID=224129 RepID=A0A1W4X2N2_AGRPL|nr:transcription initiation factor IIA subunit 1 [Agrilus planipennis]
MASSLCKTTVVRIYQDVIEDVIAGVRELFLEDGVDEHILQELKQTWEAKLMASKAVENHQNEDKSGVKLPGDAANGTNGFPKPQQQTQVLKQVVGQVPPNNHMQTAIPQVIDNKMVPIQITLPVQAGSDAGRILTIQVPAAALQNNQLQKILTGPVLTATMNLPQPLASTLLQQHVNAAFSSQQQSMNIGSVVNKSVIQTDGASNSDEEESTLPSCSSEPTRMCTRIPNAAQLDGPADTSDDDEDGSDEEDASEDVDEDRDEEDQDLDEGGPEEEPLNSEDDVTDEDPSDLFDTENVVVCQYDKITRSRNKWKFHLKDGIMNLNGEDYVFQKANGDAEW